MTRRRGPAQTQRLPADLDGDDIGGVGGAEVRWGALAAAHGGNGERYVREHFDRDRISERLWQALKDIG